MFNWHHYQVLPPSVGTTYVSTLHFTGISEEMLKLIVHNMPWTGQQKDQGAPPPLTLFLSIPIFQDTYN